MINGKSKRKNQLIRKQKQRAILTLIYMLLLIITLFNLDKVTELMDFLLGGIVATIFMTLTINICDIKSEKQYRREAEAYYQYCVKKYGIVKEG